MASASDPGCLGCFESEGLRDDAEGNEPEEAPQQDAEPEEAPQQDVEAASGDGIPGFVNLANLAAVTPRAKYMKDLVATKGWAPYPHSWLDAVVYRTNELAVAGVSLVVVGANLFFCASVFVPNLWNELYVTTASVFCMALGMIGVLLSFWVTQGPLVVSGCCVAVTGLWVHAVQYVWLTTLRLPTFGHNNHAHDDDLPESTPMQRMLVVRACGITLVFAGFSCILVRAVQRFMLPVLDNQNYVLFGALSFFSGVFNVAVASWDTLPMQGIDHFICWGGCRFGRQAEPTVAALMVLGSALFWLALGRVACFTSYELEERYPSTTSVTNTRASATTGMRGAVALLLSCALRLFINMTPPNGAIAIRACTGVAALLPAGGWLAMGHAVRTADPPDVPLSRSLALLAVACVVDAVSHLFFFENHAANDGGHAHPGDIRRAAAVAAGGWALSALGAALALRRTWRTRLGLTTFIGKLAHPGHYLTHAFALIAASAAVQTLICVAMVVEGAPLAGEGPSRRAGANSRHERFESQVSLYLWGVGSLWGGVGVLVLALHQHMASACGALAGVAESDEQIASLQDGTEPVKPDANVVLTDGDADDGGAVENFDVLISGAGPVGLCLANVLGKHGVRTLVIERRTDHVSDPRFFHCNTETMADANGYGFAAALLDASKDAVPHDHPFTDMWTTGGVQPDARAITCSETGGTAWLQSAIVHGTVDRKSECASFICRKSLQEKALTEELDKQGSVTVWRQATVLKVRQDAAGAETLVMRHHVGSRTSSELDATVRVKAKYVVGCDGPNSVVARAMGVLYDGFLNLFTPKSYLVQSTSLFPRVLAKLGAAHQYHIARAGVGVGNFMVVDQARGVWNCLVFFLDPAIKDLPVEQIVKRFFGDDIDDLVVLKHNTWFFNFLIARTWRVDRFFVAGDSSHQWPPIGGMNGNNGLMSAFNLGWKLDATLRGWGGPMLLASYEAERRSVTLRRAHWVLGVVPRPWIVYRGVELAKKWGLILKMMAAKWYFSNACPTVGNHNCMPGLMCGNRYDLSPVVACGSDSADRGREMFQDPICEYTPRVVAGARAPNVFFSNGHSLAEIFDPTRGFALLVLGREAEAGRGVPSLSSGRLPTSEASEASAVAAARNGAAALLADALHELGAPVHTTRFDIAPFPMEPSVLEGTHRDVAELYLGCALVLVRPDRYIAFAVTTEELGAFDGTAATRVARRVCGWPVDGDGGLGRTKVALSRAWNNWLTGRFMEAMQPLRAMHTKAVLCDAQTKADATQSVLHATEKSKRSCCFTKSTARDSAEFTVDNKLDAENNSLVSVNASGSMEMAHAQAATDPDFRHPWEDKFESLDDNGNGVLDGDELLELAGWAWSSVRPPTTAPPSDAVKLAELKKIMALCDTDGDGEVSRDEFAEYYTDLIQTIELARRGW